MYAVIIDGTVAELHAAPPALGLGESAMIVEVHDWEVRPGWIWTPEGCTPPQGPDPYAVEPEYLDLGQISIGHAERLYTAALAEVESSAGDGPATVLLEMLGL